MNLFSLFKSYQYKIKFLKFPSTIFMILMLKTKPSCQSVKQVSFNIILLIAFSSVHLMFPGSLWIKNVSYFCASAPISPPISATHQGIFSSLHTLCTREHLVNICVLHYPGTSSATVQTETCFKSCLSINKTLIDHGRQCIKVDSISFTTYIVAFKIIKHLKPLTFQIIHSNQVSCIYFNHSHLLCLKHVCICLICTNTINEKRKHLKRNPIIIYVLIFYITNALFLYLQKDLLFLYKSLPINALIMAIVFITTSNDNI